MKKICIGAAAFPFVALVVALAIVGGVSLCSAWAIDPNFNLDWEVDSRAERESIRRAQTHPPTSEPTPTLLPAGDFLPTISPRHELPSAFSEATTLSAGEFHTCALRPGGYPVCWGWDQYGQSSPAAPHKAQSVAAITAGGAHTCMVFSDDSFFCNGPYYYAYASRPGGFGHYRRWPGDPQPLEISPPPSSQRFFTVSSGRNHACGIPLPARSNTNVICWGGNSRGEAAPYFYMEGIKAVSSGGDFTCALRFHDSKPVCWGEAYWVYSRIIDGYFDRSSEPLRCPPSNNSFINPLCDEALELTGPGSPEYPPDDEHFGAISSGGAHVCALRLKARTPVCWGSDAWGQASPPEDERFAAVSSGRNHACALRFDGIPVCWGDDRYGQASPPEGERFAVIDAGGGHTCALRFDGLPFAGG